MAFDIERSGGRNEHETIGIGATIVDHNLNELDSLFLQGYFPKSTNFEQRCWEEFWSKYEDKLNILTYEGPLTKEERQQEMIIQFQQFRKKWEKYAVDNGIELLLVSDNNVYDGGFINDLIYRYLPNTLPIPYSTAAKYRPFFETHSEQKGFLMAVDPHFDQNWGFQKRIGELYEVPKMKRKHDHNPANDAYTIAFEQQVLFAIQRGDIKRKKVEHIK